MNRACESMDILPITKEGVILINKVAVRTASSQFDFGTNAESDNNLVTSSRWRCLHSAVPIWWCVWA